MRVRENEAIPRFHGLAWRDYLRNEAVCFLFPLNWVARWSRSAWRLVTRPRHNWIEKLEYEFMCKYQVDRRKFESLVEEEVNRRMDEAVRLVSGAILGGEDGNGPASGTDEDGTDKP